MKKHYRHENDCLNCGAELQGKFCHNCGQENLQIKESFGHMLNHAVSDYFHFDQQFFHTLKPLLFKPGQLSIEYLAGRRAQYLHPVKMYIFISLVYFILLFKSSHEVINVNHGKQPTKQEIKNAIKNGVNANLGRDGKLKKDSVILVKPAVKTTTNIMGFKVSGNNNTPIKINEGDDDDDSTYAQYIIRQNKLPANNRDGFWQRFYVEKKFSYTEKYGKNGLDVFFEDVKHNMPKMMFVLLPLFALILKLSFWRNHKYYVEHLIYAIHLHCFFFLLSGMILLIQMLLPVSWKEVSDWLGIILFFWTVWYIYRSLRVFYHRSRWRTVSKIIGISLMYLMVFCICLVGLVLATAAAA